MQLNLKDDIYSALRTLAGNQNKSIETFLEELIKSAAGKHQPTLIRDTGYATIYDASGRNWLPRFDADISDAKKHQDELDAARAREDMARYLMIARMRGDKFPIKPEETRTEDQAYAAYVERLKGRRNS